MHRYLAEAKDKLLHQANHSDVREEWQSGAENRIRGLKWLDAIYKHNRAGTIKALDAHKDFGMFVLRFRNHLQYSCFV